MNKVVNSRSWPTKDAKCDEIRKEIEAADKWLKHRYPWDEITPVTCKVKRV